MVQGEYKHRQFLCRMTFSTYMRIRIQFKPIDKYESAANYFLRLAKYLESKGGEINDKM